MTFTEKKIDDLLEYFYDKIYEKNGDIEYSDFKNWLRKAIAEAETSGLNKAISYLNDTQQKYKDDTKSLLCDYTLRIMVRDLKELEQEK